MNLLIVESPNKIRKIGGFLNSWEPNQWQVVATVGHFRGLPEMRGQSFEEVADPEAGFAEQFVVLNKKADAELRTAIKAADQSGGQVYLATDGDREGEAIAWHLAERFRLKAPIRVIAGEITKAGITRAITEARKSGAQIDQPLVDAQRARALLDYLLGMQISRRLWRFGAKSAGRLQSAALRIIVDRENQVRSFVPEEFWTVGAWYVAEGKGFHAQLAAPTTDSAKESTGAEPDEPLESPAKTGVWRLASAAEAEKVKAALSAPRHQVLSVNSKTQVRNPPKPFTTSALLQAAARQLKFSAAETTLYAQKLFEKGAITYIRTDSTALADEAVREIRSYLGAHHPALLPDDPVVTGTKGKNVQGAHEAIRPTKMTRAPEADVDGPQYALYELIFTRTLACQATPAESERTTARLRPQGTKDPTLVLTAEGVVTKARGWLELEPPPTEEAGGLPPLSEGQEVDLESLEVRKSHTKPPPRFTEEALIRYLEKRGIGRPSTYAQMVATLFSRGYITDEKRQLIPEDLGLRADHLVRLGFGDYSEEGFTADTELTLDGIARGRLKRERFLKNFYRLFKKHEAAADAALAAYAKEHPDEDRDAQVAHSAPCPKCGEKMLVRKSKGGPYALCEGEMCRTIVDLSPPKVVKRPCPACDAPVREKSYLKDKKPKKFFLCTKDCGWKSGFPPPQVSKDPCPKCGARLWLKGKGDKRFWSCQKFPECKGSKSWG